ncbi:MAG: polysaccharide biosynthesis tyrosine autokinase [Chloroflexi bacterium]|nr:polysaccharide biosynthesis tyrosine autokinase [Chloroflexota bacterium]
MLYEASAKVLVEGRQTPGTPSSGDIRVGQELAAFYSDLILTRPILQSITENLAPDYTTDKLSASLSISSEGSFIRIAAVDENPVTAALVANTSARTFIDVLQARQLDQIAQFQESLNDYGISQDLTLLAAQVSGLQTLTIVEEALPPPEPFNPANRLRDTLLAGVIGLSLAGLIVFGVEYFDDSIKSAEHLQDITGLVSLGIVPKQKTENIAKPILLSHDAQGSPLSETYKYVVLNLEFSALEKGQLNTLVVASALPSEGKTTNAVNTAIAMARSGKSVILVDSDLRKPSLHEIFGISEDKGLTNVLLGNSSIEEVLVETSVPGLSVVVSGPIPPDSTRVLRTPRMAEVVKELEDRADFVIFDSPPVLAVADSIVLASLVDGVLFVVDAHKSRRESLVRAVQNVRQVNQMVVGAVLNRVAPKSHNEHYHYYHQYSSNGSPSSNGRLKWVTNPFRNGNKHVGLEADSKSSKVRFEDRQKEK